MLVVNTRQPSPELHRRGLRREPLNCRGVPHEPSWSNVYDLPVWPSTRTPLQLQLLSRTEKFTLSAPFRMRTLVRKLGPENELRALLGSGWVEMRAQRNLVQMAAQRESKVDNICPECRQQFRGRGVQPALQLRIKIRR